ncbi:hypothetical protein EV401DRAFT_2083369 [Pisolithus croceorrhizus]|nr:hypothetical protein EV401DRAFT_2083369 [Pisolithus croceorrhizus]
MVWQPRRIAFGAFWVAQQSCFGSYRVAAYAARCAIHLAPYPIHFDLFTIALVLPSVLDISKHFVDLLLASWPSSST